MEEHPKAKTAGALLEDAYAMLYKYIQTKINCKYVKHTEGAQSICTSEHPCHGYGRMCVFYSLKHVPVEELTKHDLTYKLQDTLNKTAGLKGNAKKNAVAINLEKLLLNMTGEKTLSAEQREMLNSFVGALNYVIELQDAKGKQAQINFVKANQKIFKNEAKKAVYHNKTPNDCFAGILNHVVICSKPFQKEMGTTYAKNELLPDEKYHRNLKNTKYDHHAHDIKTPKKTQRPKVLSKSRR